MAELPDIPDFDPTAPAPTTAAAPSTAEPPLASAPPPAPPAAPGSSASAAMPKVARPAARRPQVASEAPAQLISAPGAPPAPTTVSAVQDSVEEVLQQASAQALQLSHLEDVLAALNQTLHDLQEEMHAGFAEIRAVVESQATSSLRATAVAGSQSATQRIEFVEEKLDQSQKRQGLLTALAVGNLVLLLLLLLFTLWDRAEPANVELPAAAHEELPSDTRVTEPGSDDIDPRPTPIDDLSRSKKKKRRR